MSTPRFDCTEVDDLAGLFVLDALTPEESAGVREHLATCDQPHESFAEMALMGGVLAASADPVDAPVELRAQIMSAVATTAQVPDDVHVVVRTTMVDDVKVAAPVVVPAVAPVVAPVVVPAVAPVVAPAVVPAMTAQQVTAAEPISIDAARQRRGPSRMAWFGLAAAAVIVIAALGAWNVSLQRQVSDAQGQVASLQQAVTTAQQEAIDANGQLTSLQGRITDTEAQLTAALQRANTSEAQLTSLQTQLQQMQVQVASYQQQIASADDRVALIGQAVGAATAAGSNVATLASTSPAGGSAAGMAIFPATGPGYIMIEGLPELGADQTYQAWYGSGGHMTSAALVTPGPHGLAIVGNLDPIAGTDTIALTVEAAGGADQPTGSPVIAGTLPTVVALGGTISIQ
jgi:hypothetical protein